MIYITSGRERQARPVEQKPQNTPPRLPGLSARRATSREWTDLASPTTAAGQLLQHIDTMLVATSARQERAAWLNAIKATSVLTANNISLLLARAGRGHDGEPREESFRRARLLEALAHAPSSSHVVPSLTTMLTNKSNLTRTFAAMALAQMGPNAAESSQDLTAAGDKLVPNSRTCRMASAGWHRARAGHGYEHKDPATVEVPQHDAKLG